MNIVEILKDCPEGTKLYSPLFGECKLMYVDYKLNQSYPITVEVGDENHCFTKDGLFYREHIDGECMLFPSKDNRDWSTFKAPKKNVFKPFDKVLVKDCEEDNWKCNFFSHYCDNDTYPYYCIDSLYKYCIPYKGNEHLVGTSNSSN